MCSGITKMNNFTAQEFNKGIFDYLIATDDPAKRAEQAARLDNDKQQAAGDAGSIKKPGAKRRRQQGGQEGQPPLKKRQRAGGDAEFGVVRGIDFKGVRTVINVDVPDSVEVRRVLHASAYFRLHFWLFKPGGWAAPGHWTTQVCIFGVQHSTLRRQLGPQWQLYD